MQARLIMMSHNDCKKRKLISFMQQKRYKRSRCVNEDYSELVVFPNFVCIYVNVLHVLIIFKQMQ